MKDPGESLVRCLIWPGLELKACLRHGKTVVPRPDPYTVFQRWLHVPRANSTWDVGAGGEWQVPGQPSQDRWRRHSQTFFKIKKKNQNLAQTRVPAMTNMIFSFDFHGFILCSRDLGTLLLFISLFLFYLFEHEVSLCSLGWAGACFVNQAGLTLIETTCLCLLSSGINVCNTKLVCLFLRQSSLWSSWKNCPNLPDLPRKELPPSHYSLFIFPFTKAQKRPHCHNFLLLFYY